MEEIQKVMQIGIPVKQMERAIEFYRQKRKRPFSDVQTF